MEIITELQDIRPRLKVAVFDFDGTISTLRHGWEEIMEPLMLEMISGSSTPDDEFAPEVREYINQSTGIQTIYQMQWLAATVKKYGRNPKAPDDPWWYKAEYNRRLMEPVGARIQSILSGSKKPEDFLVAGSVEFLSFLLRLGIGVYVASGTDHPDVVREAGVLGLKGFFREIAGAPPGRADCSKEAVLRKLVSENNLAGPEVVVIGDGKVEIALGREVGALTLGVASNEDRRSGMNPLKRDRLANAGAHAIVGDFTQCRDIIGWLGLDA